MDEFGKGDLAKIEAAKPQEGILLMIEKPVQPVTYVNAIRNAIGLREMEAMEGGEEDVLRDKITERIRTTDKSTLREVLKILSK
jgi:hypothetical protein